MKQYQLLVMDLQIQLNLDGFLDQKFRTKIWTVEKYP